MKNNFLLISLFTLNILSLAFLKNSSAQTDTIFWFAAPEITKDHACSDMVPFLRFANTTSEEATITINMPAVSLSGGFEEKLITLPGNATTSFNLYNYLPHITIPKALHDEANKIYPFENHYREDLDIKGKNNRGIQIISTQPITCYFEDSHVSNSDIFVLKGSNGLGSDFYTTFQTIFYNHDGEWNGSGFVGWDRPSYSCFIVTFTEDNSYMTLSLPSGKQLMDGTTGTKTFGPFMKGETYVGVPHHNLAHANFVLRDNIDHEEAGTAFKYGRTGSDHLSGVHIQTHDETGLYEKSVTVMISDDSMKSLKWWPFDLGGDQIVPISSIGCEYLVVKGALSSVITDSLNTDYGRRDNQQFAGAHYNNLPPDVEALRTKYDLEIGENDYHSLDENGNSRTRGNPTETILDNGEVVRQGFFYWEGVEYHFDAFLDSESNIKFVGLYLNENNKFHQETCYVVATCDNTHLTFTSYSGRVTKDTLHRGETRPYSLLSKAVHIQTNADHPVYVLQITGEVSEMGAAILPCLDKCTGSSSISFFPVSPGTDWAKYLNIVVKDYVGSPLTLNGSSIPVNEFNTLKGYKFYKGEPNIVDNAQNTLTNSDDLFLHMALYLGKNDGGARMGFFSGFSQTPVIKKASIDGEDVDGLCANHLKLYDASEGALPNQNQGVVEYQWYRNNYLIADSTRSEYYAESAGTYHVKVKQSCNGDSVWSFASNTIDVPPCLEVTLANPNLEWGQIPEDIGMLKVVVELSEPITKDVSFSYRLLPGDGTNAATPDKTSSESAINNFWDYENKSDTITIEAGRTSKNIFIPIHNDQLFEGDIPENFFLILDNAKYAEILVSELEVKIQDDDTMPTLSFPLNAQSTEDQEWLEFDLTLSNPSKDTLDIVYKLEDRAVNSVYTAIDGKNFVVYNGTLTFEPLQTTRTLRIQILDDKVYYPDGYAVFNIKTLYNTDDAGTQINDGFVYDLDSDGNAISSAHVKIVDNEELPTLTIPFTCAVEGDPVKFEPMLSHPCAEAVQFTAEAKDLLDTESTEAKARIGTNYQWGSSSIQYTINAFEVNLTNADALSVQTIDDGVASMSPLFFKLQLKDFVHCDFSQPKGWTEGAVLDSSGKHLVMINSCTAYENEGKLRFPVTVVPENKEDITFNFETIANGTPLTDFETSSGNFTIPAHTTETLYIEIGITNNCYYSGTDRTINLKVSDIQNSTHARLLSEVVIVEGKIMDDEAELIAKDDIFIVNRNHERSINVLDNDLGIDLDNTPAPKVVWGALPHDFSAAAISRHPDGTITFYPSATIPYGSYVFPYEVVRCKESYDLPDSESLFARGVVRLVITPPTDLFPVDDAYTIQKRIAGNNPLYPNVNDHFVLQLNDSILSNDRTTPTTQILIEQQPLHGTIQLESDGKSLTYMPHDYFYGNDLFTYRLLDGIKSAKTATVNIDVLFRNYFRPEAQDATIIIGAGEFEGDQLQRYLIDFNRYVTDQDNGPRNEYYTLDINGVSIPTEVKHGTLERVPGTYLYYYTPQVDYIGPDQFKYSIKDESIDGDESEESELATITLDIRRGRVPDIEANTPLVLPLDSDGLVSLTSDMIFRDYNPAKFEYKINGSVTALFTCIDIGTQYVFLEKTGKDTGVTAQLFNIPVNIIDNIPPLLPVEGSSDDPNSNTDHYWYIPDGHSTTTVTWSIPTATDQCQQLGVELHKLDNNNNGGGYTEGNYVVRYQAEDNAGNISSPYQFQFSVAKELVVNSPIFASNSHCANDNVSFSSYVTGGFSSENNNQISGELEYEWYFLEDSSTSYQEIMAVGSTDPFLGKLNVKDVDDQTKCTLLNVPAGTHTIILQVTDAVGASKGESLTFTVKELPILTPFSSTTH